MLFLSLMMLLLQKVYKKKARMNSSCLGKLKQYNVILLCLYHTENISYPLVKMMELVGCMTMRSLKSGPNQLCGRSTHVEERKV